MKKKITKEMQEKMEEWIKNNGACSFDYKNKDIILHDGGLFSIDKEKYMAHKILGFKKLPNGYSQVIFSKKKVVPSEKYKAILWMDDLNETINYLKRMKSMLNSIGIKTNISIKNKKGIIGKAR